MGSASFFEKKLKKIFWSIAGGSLSPEHRRPEKIESVLVLRPDRLGDFILSVPALAALRDKLGPSGNLTLVAGERNWELARFLFPEAKVWVSRKNLFSRIGLWLSLWLNSFDAVIDLHSYPFSTTTTLMAVLSGASVRVGFWAEGDFKEYEAVSRKVFNFGTKAPAENLSETEKSFLLVRKLLSGLKSKPLKMELSSIPLKTIAAVHDFYAQLAITSEDKVLGIHPTLQKEDNRWSQEKYLELIRQLSTIKRLKIVVLHGKGEGEELARFQKLSMVFSNLFTLPNDDLFFILEAAKRFDGLVCNDSGIMHLCAWVTPVFAIFGPSNAKRWGLQRNRKFRHQVFQATDGLCDSVSPRKVAEVVKRKLFHSR